MPISLVVVDDHRLILDGLQSLFRQEADFRVLAECSNGAQALDAVKCHKPDILVLDLRMKDVHGLEVLRAMAGEGMPTRVVVLTAALDEDQVVEAIRLGAKGIVLKEMAPRLLVQCIREVHAGAEWLDDAPVDRALGRLPPKEAGEQGLGLTEREMDVVRFVSKGLQNKDIASELGISEGTVKAHVHHIYAKLGLSNRVELAVYAREKGIIGG
jgi:two-component system, NarL family, nitrate/nitrite response regulator NarL